MNSLKFYPNINSNEYIEIKCPENYKSLVSRINEINENYLKYNSIIYKDDEDNIYISNEEDFSIFKEKFNTIYLIEKKDYDLRTVETNKTVTTIFNTNYGENKKKEIEDSLNYETNNFVENEKSISESINQNTDINLNNENKIPNNRIIEMKLQEYSNKIEDFQKELNVKNNDIIGLKEKNKIFEKTIKELKEKIENNEKDNEIKKLKEGNDILEKKLKEMENKIKILEENEEKKNIKINELENKLIELKEKIENKEKDNEIKKIIEGNKILEKKLNEIENKIRNNNLLENRINELEKKIQLSNPKNIEIEKEKKIKECKEEIIEKEKEINELNINIKKCAQDNEKLKEIIKNLENKLKENANEKEKEKEKEKKNIINFENYKKELEEEFNKKSLNLKNHINDYLKNKMNQFINDLSLDLFNENKKILKKEFDDIYENEKKRKIIYEENVKKEKNKKEEINNKKTYKCHFCKENLINIFFQCEYCDEFYICEKCKSQLNTKNKEHIYNHTFQKIKVLYS